MKSTQPPTLSIPLLCPKYCAASANPESGQTLLPAIKQGIDWLLRDMYDSLPKPVAIATVPPWLAPYLENYERATQADLDSTYSDKLAYFKPYIEHYLALELVS